MSSFVSGMNVNMQNGGWMVRITLFSALLFLNYYAVECQIVEKGLLSPLPNAENVSRTAQITIVFSGSIDISTINSISLAIRGNVMGNIGIQGNYTLDEDFPNTIHFNLRPGYSLRAGEVVYVTLNPTIQFLDGSALQPFSYRFTVVAEGNGREICQIPYTELFTCGGDPIFRVDNFVPTDIDQDGDVDIIYGIRSSENVLGLYENLLVETGILAFRDSRDNAEAVGVNFLAVGDLDMDGNTDIIASAEGTGFLYYLNTGGNTISSFTPELLATENSARSVDVKDIDNDGDLDILASYGNQFKLFLNEMVPEGSLRFTPILIEPSLSQAERVIAEDLNNDGRLDIIAISQNNGELFWYPQVDDLVFDKILIDNMDILGATSIHAAEFDQDGDLDLVVSSSGSGKISWYRNDAPSSGNINEGKKVDNAARNATFAFTADLNGNGRQDILASTLTQSTRVILAYTNTGSGAPPFSPACEINTSLKNAETIYAVDIDNDHDMDIIASSLDNSRISFFLNDNTINYIQGPQQVCINSPTTYQALRVPGDNDYTWRVEGGCIMTPTGCVPNPPKAASNTLDTIEIMWDEIGTGRIFLEQNRVCVAEPQLDFLEVEITEIDQPNFTGNLIREVCVQDTVTYRSNLSVDDEIEWTILGDRGEILGSRNLPTVDVIWEEAGNETLILEKIDQDNSCQESNQLSIEIFMRPDFGDIVGDSIVCQALDERNAVRYNVFPDPSADNYVWTASGGDVIFGQGEQVVEILWNSPNLNGIDTISVIAENSQGCRSVEKKLAVRVLSPPNTTIIRADPEAEPCQGENIRYRIEGNNPRFIYRWTVVNEVDGRCSDEEDCSPKFGQEVEYNFKDTQLKILKVEVGIDIDGDFQFDFGCIDSSTRSIRPKPTLEQVTQDGETLYTCLDKCQLLDEEGNIVASNSVFCSGRDEIDERSYPLDLDSISTCDAGLVEARSAQVLPLTFQVPTAFTPGPNPIGETLEDQDKNSSVRITPTNLALVDKAQLTIRNKEGNVVYQSRNTYEALNEGWDGRGRDAGLYISIAKVWFRSCSEPVIKRQKLRLFNLK